MNAGEGDETASRDRRPVYVISIAAELAGMHPQTLRQYDRLGLVRPSRTAGRGRRYSARDVALLREVQRLSQEEGVNLAGIKRIIALEARNAALDDEVAGLRADLEVALGAVERSSRVFAAGSAGDTVAVRRGRRAAPRSRPGGGALVVWRPQR